MDALQQAAQAIAGRRLDEALAALERAEAAAANPNACRSHRWLCHMLLGRFEEAWRESARIAESGQPDPNALWDGQPFTGKRVMVRCLHGFGDAIQFIRYAQLLRRQATRVLAQVHPQLMALLSCVPGVDQVIGWQQEDPALWDQQIEVMELPRAFRTTLDTIPDGVPYIRVPEAYRIRSRVPPPPPPQLRRPDARLRVGLQWSAGEWDPERSIGLRQLSPLREAADCEWFSFQRGAGRDELAGVAAWPGIRDVSGDSPDILNAAADLLNIDLLVTVDTMLAHLAGALGRPVWVLLPFRADWRWMLHRRDSPWYPSMRLFRQPAQGEWNPAVKEMAGALRRLAAGDPD